MDEIRGNMMNKLLLCLLFLFGNSVYPENHWGSPKYIWNFGIASLCDKGLPKKPSSHFLTYPPPFKKIMYQDIQEGDIIWLRCSDVSHFTKEVLPYVNAHFAVVISHGVKSFPSECGLGNDSDLFIKNEKVLHIFAQNCDYKGDSHKVSHLPIGIDYHTLAFKYSKYWGESGASPIKQEEVLDEILSTFKPTHERLKRAFVDFQHRDTMKVNPRYNQSKENRTVIFQKLLKTGLIDFSKDKLSRSTLWKTKGQYAFSISPHGDGLDCHRTWEDLLLGCIVIVKTSALDPLYEGLPVVIINDWSEVNAENMDEWIELYGDAFENPEYREKLTNEYWFNKIKQSTL